MKENIIINEPTDDFTYSFEITANNLILTLQEYSSIIAADSETEESIYVIPTMFMYDDKISYTYSPEKYLTSQSFNDTEQYSWDYNAAGEVYKYTDKSNGLYSLYDYDTMKRVSMKTIFLSNNTRKSVTSYSYDLKGNVTDITNNAGRYTFSFNRLFRIIIKIFGIIVPKYYILKPMMS